MLFRVVEGAPVALYRAHDDAQAELVVSRYDLFQYEGGYAWGYQGTGPQSLSHALAALVYPAIFDRGVLADKAREILEKVVSQLPQGAEPNIPVSHIYQECGEPELIE
ncbi:hypothetical protein FGL86_05780 [Pistricoccus aurantiacus]|uniref:Uncharacterized protein n=1 Tax=Pistricoccus aurantiacus TaxID=1883414 RepID=A0A5B8T1F9_9GAMM|nr:hypothetical protein FGL86_05780 [Pistricoccus aurantiacus]